MSAKVASAKAATTSGAKSAPRTPKQRDDNWNQLEQSLNQTSKRPGIKIIDLDMPDDQVKELVNLTNEAMDVTKIECEIADKVKTYFDNTYPGPWHCIAGKKFTSKVQFEGQHFCYLHVGTHIAVLLFKAKSGEPAAAAAE